MALKLNGQSTQSITLIDHFLWHEIIILFFGEGVKMKKYWKWLVLILVTIVVIVAGMIFYRRDSNGKPFKASLNHSKVMMTPDWYAKVTLTANKGTTYEVKNSKNKVIQGKSETKNGKAEIRLNDTGNYTVIAKSDNGHVSKKLPVKVNHYKAAPNKWTSSVGPLRFKITSVEYQKMKKSEANKPDNSGIDEAYKELNHHYYQVKVNYIVKNSSKKAVNPQYTIWMPEDDNGQEFSTETPSPDGGAVDTIIGTEAINPDNSRSGSVTMLSNHKFTVKHFKFSIEEVLGNEGNHIAKGGVAELK